MLRKLSKDEAVVIEKHFNQLGTINNIICAVQTLISFLDLNAKQIENILKSARNKIHNEIIDLIDSESPIKETMLQKVFLRNLLTLVKEHADQNRKLILYRDYKRILQWHSQNTQLNQYLEFYQDKLITDALLSLKLKSVEIFGKQKYKLKDISVFPFLATNIKTIKNAMNLSHPNSWIIYAFKLGAVVNCFLTLFILARLYANDYEFMSWTARLALLLASLIGFILNICTIADKVLPHAFRLIYQYWLYDLQLPDIKLDLRTVEDLTISNSSFTQPEYSFAVFERNTVDQLALDSISNVSSADEKEDEITAPKTPKRNRSSLLEYLPTLPNFSLKKPPATSPLELLPRNNIMFAEENKKNWGKENFSAIINNRVKKSVHYYGFFNGVSLKKQGLTDTDIKNWHYKDRVIGGKFVPPKGVSGIKYLKYPIQLNPRIENKSMGMTVFTQSAKTVKQNERCLAYIAEHQFSRDGDTHILLDFCWHEMNKRKLGHN